MSERSALERLRSFLFLLSAALFLGTIGELIAVEHYKEWMQLVPFALCGLGLLSLLVLWRGPSRAGLVAVRALMVVIALGSLLGVYQHVSANYEFVSEVRPDASTAVLVRKTISGADPLMAPGVLAVAAAVALAASFASTALARGEKAGMQLEFVPEESARNGLRSVG